MKREIGEYIPPGFEKEAFHCPHCNFPVPHRWSRAHTYIPDRQVTNLAIAYCSHCGSYSCWIDEKMVYPSNTTAPLAASDMPLSVREYYEEARSIANLSPRAAAALLRLAAKKLCEELGEHEQNLSRAIGNLRKRELPEAVIQSLDTVRIVGNEGGAHEGQIDLSDKDNAEVVDRLFKLINIIVEKTITEPKYIKETFSSLPENKRKAIANRDNS